MSSKTLRRKGNGTFGGQNAGKSFKIKGKQLPSTSVQRLFSAVYRPDTLNSSKSSGGDTVRVRPPLPAPILDVDYDTIYVIYFLHPSVSRNTYTTKVWTASFTRLQDPKYKERLRWSDFRRGFSCSWMILRFRNRVK